MSRTWENIDGRSNTSFHPSISHWPKPILWIDDHEAAAESKIRREKKKKKENSLSICPWSLACVSTIFRFIIRSWIFTREWRVVPCDVLRFSLETLPFRHALLRAVFRISPFRILFSVSKQWESIMNWEIRRISRWSSVLFDQTMWERGSEFERKSAPPEHFRYFPVPIFAPRWRTVCENIDEQCFLHVRAHVNLRSLLRQCWRCKLTHEAAWNRWVNIVSRPVHCSSLLLLFTEVTVFSSNSLRCAWSLAFL